MSHPDPNHNDEDEGKFNPELIRECVEMLDAWIADVINDSVIRAKRTALQDWTDLKAYIEWTLIDD